MSRWAVPLVMVVTFGAANALSATTGEPAGARLVTPMPVTSLAVSGSTVGFATGTGEPNEGAVFVWSIADGQVIRKGTAEKDNGLLGDVALTGSGEIVWIKWNETNHLDGWVLVAPVSRGAVRTLYSRTDVDLPGHIAAARGVVAFSTGAWSSGRPVVVWVGTTHKIRVAWKTPSLIDHLAVEGGIVAVGLKGGGVEVLRTTGEHVLTLAGGTATGGLEVDEGRLVVMKNRTLSVISIATGRISRSRPLARAAKLLDAQGDLVVYRTGTELRVLRLSDGRKALIPTKTAELATPPTARFGTPGLVTASGTVLQVVPKVRLARLLGG